MERLALSWGYVPGSLSRLRVGTAEPHRRNGKWLGIRISEPGRSWVRAKDGGSPRCCPVLCGLRDRCIAAMLATLKGRDTKAELNRRRQACEVLADTGIRVAKNGLPSRSLAREREACLRSSSLGWATSPHSVGRRLVEHQGSAPCIPVWLAIRSSERESERPSVAQSYGGHPSLWGAKDGRPACISQHLCSEKWNPVLESHQPPLLGYGGASQPLRFCKPPPELLGQRDLIRFRQPMSDRIRCAVLRDTHVD